MRSLRTKWPQSPRVVRPPGLERSLMDAIAELKGTVEMNASAAAASAREVTEGSKRAQAKLRQEVRISGAFLERFCVPSPIPRAAAR